MLEQAKTEIAKLMDKVDRDELYSILSAVFRRVALLVLLAAIFLTGVVCDVVLAVGDRTLGGLGGGPPGVEATLEETILDSDVIVVAKLGAISRGAGPFYVHVFDSDRLLLRYSKTLNFTFEVSEYLKGGTGSNQVVGIVYRTVPDYQTRSVAYFLGREPHPERDTTWDDREAVVFLREINPTAKGGNHYDLGVAADYWDTFSIKSQESKRWLPAASADAAGAQEFLTRRGTKTRAQETITLAELKARIAELNAEMKAGASRDCLIHKHYELGRRRWLNIVTKADDEILTLSSQDWCKSKGYM